MPETPVIQHAQTPVLDSATEPARPTDRAVPYAPAIAALTGLVALAAAGYAAVLALAGVL